MVSRPNSMSGSEWKQLSRDPSLGTVASVESPEPQTGKTLRDASLGALQDELMARKPLFGYSSTDLMHELRERGIKTEFLLVPNRDNKRGLENRIVIETCEEFGVRPNITALRGRGNKGVPNFARKVVCYLACELGIDRELIRIMLHFSSSSLVCRHNAFIRGRVQTDRELLGKIAKIYKKVKFTT
tara:strand:- start:5218 stop:5775 length:558 start_codon:yes stop_codon:yes gene_type:complete